MQLDDFILYLDENLDICQPIIAEMAQALLAAVPEMRDLARSLGPPFEGSIARPG